jgi:hypothetical protein
MEVDIFLSSLELRWLVGISPSLKMDVCGHITHPLTEKKKNGGGHLPMPLKENSQYRGGQPSFFF